ncbi:MAG: molecular chaperone DnaK, partial [Pseudomonadota bacterium]
EKEKIEAAIKHLEGVLASDDKEAIDTKTEALTEVSHKLAEQMYAQAQTAAGATDAQSAGAAEGASPNKANENVVDAEFEEVKDDKKK